MKQDHYLDLRAPTAEPGAPRAVGLFFASSTLSILTAFVGRFTARTGDIQIDPPVLLFTLGLSLLTGIVFGTLPALSSRTDLANAMKSGTKGGGDRPGGRRIQNTLIVGQVALSVVLLVGAGLLLASLVRLQRVDGGYSGDNVTSAEAFPNFSKYPKADTISGISGVIALSVSQRIDEFGLRMALGASRPRVLKQVMAEGLRLVVIGLAVGLAGSLAATKVLAAYLFATRPSDPLTLLLVSLALLATAVASCAGPAWRATSADPLRALRAE